MAVFERSTHQTSKSKQAKTRVLGHFFRFKAIQTIVDFDSQVPFVEVATWVPMEVIETIVSKLSHEKRASGCLG